MTTFKHDTRSASDHRAAARACFQRADESFDRCDTDGFLSQWASSLTANLHNRQAEILEGNGEAVFVGLYDGDRRVHARLVEGQWGTSWLLADAEITRYGRRWIPNGSNSRIQKSLGLREEQELAPAYAEVIGRGYGLSGSAWVVATRRDPWGADAHLAPIGPDFPVLGL